MGFFIEYLICKKKNEVTQLVLQAFVFPHAIQIGIGFQYVQVCIHGLSFVGIFFTQTHIVNLAPLTSQGFTITVLYLVKAMSFYALKKMNGISECLGICRGAVIFAQPVNGKANGVDLAYNPEAERQGLEAMYELLDKHLK